MMSTICVRVYRKCAALAADTKQPESPAAWSAKSTHYQDESQKISGDILLARPCLFGYNARLLVFGRIA